MKYYYYSTNGKDKLGPYTLDDLKERKLLDHYLVWCDGMDEWQKASKCLELSEFAIKSPPPLPAADSINVTNSGLPAIFYKKETWITYCGIALLFVGFVIALGSKDLDAEGRQVATIFILMFRFFFIFLVYEVVTNQNRNNGGWAILTFFFPSVSMIIIGLLNKKPIEIDSRWNTDEKINLARTKMEQLKYDDCLNLSDSVLVDDPLNIDALHLSAKANFMMQRFAHARQNLDSLVELGYKLEYTMYSLGLVLMRLGKAESAEKAWQSTLSKGNVFIRHIEAMRNTPARANTMVWPENF